MPLYEVIVYREMPQSAMIEIEAESKQEALQTAIDMDLGKEKITWDNDGWEYDARDPEVITEDGNPIEDW